MADSLGISRHEHVPPCNRTELDPLVFTGFQTNCRVCRAFVRFSGDGHVSTDCPGGFCPCCDTVLIRNHPDRSHNARVVRGVWPLCSGCMNPCANCDSRVCDECMHTCANCDRRVCDECMHTCAVCDTLLCGNCLRVDEFSSPVTIAACDGHTTTVRIIHKST